MLLILYCLGLAFIPVHSQSWMGNAKAYRNGYRAFDVRRFLSPFHLSVKFLLCHS